MIITLPETISPVEIVWTIIGSVGFLAHVLMLVYCVQDKLFLNKHKLNGARTIVANNNITRQIGYAIVQACFISIGLHSMGLPQNNETQLVSGILIIIAELVLVAISMINHRDRGRLLSYLGGRRRTDS